jgi:hypothetical protein
MPTLSTRRLLSLGLLGPLLVAGCGGKSVVLAEVEGTLSWQGAPLENVLVEFIPDETKGTSGPRSTGVTDATGLCNPNAIRNELQRVKFNPGGGGALPRNLPMKRNVAVIGPLRAARG